MKNIYKFSITTALAVVSSALLCCGCGKQNDILDNYSFSVGVWCAEQALKNGTPFKTNEFYKDGWTMPNGINHGEILHAARHEAITNGWPQFNNREGFTGDE